VSGIQFFFFDYIVTYVNVCGIRLSTRSIRIMNKIIPVAFLLLQNQRYKLLPSIIPNKIPNRAEINIVAIIEGPEVIFSLILSRMVLMAITLKNVVRRNVSQPVEIEERMATHLGDLAVLVPLSSILFIGVS